VVLLGSTGSIGVSTLKMAKKLNIEVEVLVAGFNYKLLNQQIKEFNPKVVLVANKEIRDKINHDNVYVGESEILSIIANSKSDLIVNALVGFLGLRPTIESIRLGKTVALANKETLVVAGKFIDISKIILIDSEHFGLSYLLNGKKVSKLTITASGGALRDMPLSEIKNASINKVLSHPNWNMGNKITCDSATMVNKVFELMEAIWFFDTKNVDAVIEKNSYIHSIIDFIDGSSTMHLAIPDMTLPIAFALNPNLNEPILPHIDLINKSFEFKEIEISRYPIWEYKDNILNNLDLGVVINASNEIAINDFFKHKINFSGITKCIVKNMEKYENIKIGSIDDIFEADKEIRMSK